MQSDADATLWFSAPEATDQRRPTLTRQHVVTEALTLIAEDGVPALTMRGLAARLGVVPGALYRHVPNKDRLQDLVLDGVLAEVDCDVDHTLPWAEQVTELAHRLRTVLAAHPGVAALLTTRDMRRFETTLRRAIPKGHNLHLPRSTASRSTTYIGLLSAFVTHSTI